ncbi:discoidin domain-containing protein [Prolixibacteraceae bacterium]|nr:discoidin domain-containing protein [Prolixibacteraceae bacterium]
MDIKEGASNVFDEDINTSYTFRKALKKGDYIGVDLISQTPIRSIDIYQSSSRDHIKEGILEFSNDGETWKALSKKRYSGPIVHFTETDYPVKARYIRYVSEVETQNGKGNWVKIHDIFINRNEPFATLVYSSRPFKNMPFQIDQNSLHFSKKLEVTAINPNQKIILSFLRDENINTLDLDFGGQYDQLYCYIVNKDGNKVELKSGLINGALNINQPIKRLIIENKSSKPQSIRLLNLTLTFNRSFDLTRRLTDQNLHSSYPLKPKDKMDITQLTQNHSYILFKENPKGVQLEITNNNGEVVKFEVQDKMFKIPNMEHVTKCRLINISQRAIDMVEIM